MEDKDLLEQKIKDSYQGYADYSLLGCAIARIRISKQAMTDLAILDAFVATMPADEFRLFSGIDVWSTKSMSVGTGINEDLSKNLKTVVVALEDLTTFCIAIPTSGEVFRQAYQESTVEPTSLCMGQADIATLIAACGYGIPGTKVHAVMLPIGGGYKMTYSHNGYKYLKGGVILIRRTEDPRR